MATKMNKLLALFLAITMLLSMTVFAVDPSIDGSVELICGMEEHIHNESCVLTVANCAFGEDASHVHTDDCYMSISVCEKAAHIHNLDCIKTAENSNLIPGSENPISGNQFANPFALYNHAPLTLRTFNPAPSNNSRTAITTQDGVVIDKTAEWTDLEQGIAKVDLSVGGKSEAIGVDIIYIAGAYQ